MCVCVAPRQHVTSRHVTSRHVCACLLAVRAVQMRIVEQLRVVQRDIVFRRYISRADVLAAVERIVAAETCVHARVRVLAWRFVEHSCETRLLWLAVMQRRAAAGSHRSPQVGRHAGHHAACV